MTRIVDLVDLCDEQYATSLGWFRALGERVRGEPDAVRQRLFATAAHRHAWHAELWARRRPAIPHDAAHVLPEPAAVDVGGDLVAAYRAHLAEQQARLARLATETDPDLDPATVRLVTLVGADLADLATRLP